MMSSQIRVPVDVGDVITGVRYGLAFDTNGHARSVRKLTRKCRQLLERIPAATGYRPRRDGVVSLSLHRREMEQRWRELSFIVQGACAQCPLHARSECRGARFS